MVERHWHELCFTGAQDPEPLIEAAEAAGYKFEFGGTASDEGFVGTPVLLERAEQRVGKLEAELAAAQRR